MNQGILEKMLAQVKKIIHVLSQQSKAKQSRETENVNVGSVDQCGLPLSS